MRSFLNLVSFEYKKIFKRKSSVIALLLTMIAVIASSFVIFVGTSYIDGEPYESHYQGMLKDRAYARALSGRIVDETLLTETKDAFSKIPPGERFGTTPEYQQYARPYLEIYMQMYEAYNTNIEGIRELTDKDIQNFYQIRHDRVTDGIRASAISAAAKEAMINLDSQIDTPFMFEWSGGFDNLFSSIYTIGIVCTFALAVCFAPMFAGEYSTRTDQLILSSKQGKSKLITAKIFTAISISMMFYILLIVITTLLCASIYGLDGTNTPLQLLIPLIAYPLTMLEAILIFAVCTFLGILLMVALTLLLSSKFKSPFGVIIIISVLLFTPMMLHVPETIVWLHNLYSLLPICMMTVGEAFSHVPLDFFGMILPPYIFSAIFAILASMVMLPFARRAFQNHQIR